MTPIKTAAGALLLVATLAPAGSRADPVSRNASAAFLPVSRNGWAALRGSQHPVSGTRASAVLLRALVSPRIGRAPAIIRIEALVEPGDANRALEFIIDSTAYYRSSTIELNGADAPRLHRVEFRSVPAGTHDVYVTLTGASGAVRAMVRDRVALFE